MQIYLTIMLVKIFYSYPLKHSLFPLRNGPKKPDSFFVFLSVLSRRVMPLWAAVFVYRIRRRVFGCQVPGEAALR